MDAKTTNFQIWTGEIFGVGRESDIEHFNESKENWISLFYFILIIQLFEKGKK